MKKLKDLIKELKLLEASGFGDYEVVTAVDDEGTGFNPICYEPSCGHFNSNNGTFTHLDRTTENTPVNAICIN